MSRYLRFLAISLTENLKIMTGIFAVIFVAGHLFPQNTFVSTYYGVMPFVVLMLGLTAAAAIATSQLSTAVTMGGSRRDYFWSIHLNPVIYTAYSVIVLLFFRQFRPEGLGINVIMAMDLRWIALGTFVAFYAGTALGILTTKHPYWGVAIIALCCGVGGGFVGFNSVRFIDGPPVISFPIAAVVSLVAVLLWNVYLKRYIERFSV